MATLLERGLGRFRNMIQRPVGSLNLYLTYVRGKSGIEIGGPSESFQARRWLPLYPSVGALDNCDFSSRTVWAEHTPEFVYARGKAPGRTFVCDGSRLEPIADAAYDFVLSAHNLEHFANPVKALHEWKRVLRPGGALVLVLPFYRNTFDHRRTPTPVGEMLADYERNVGEDDLTHLEEILEKHDLERDPGAGSRDAFEARCRDNFNNRCLHHHVFDESNSRVLLESVGFTVKAVDLAQPFHLCLLAER